jgi:hypothetical protein
MSAGEASAPRVGTLDVRFGSIPDVTVIYRVGQLGARSGHR